jgi:hypothetical protein
MNWWSDSNFAGVSFAFGCSLRSAFLEHFHLEFLLCCIRNVNSRLSEHNMSLHLHEIINKCHFFETSEICSGFQSFVWSCQSFVAILDKWIHVLCLFQKLCILLSSFLFGIWVVILGDLFSDYVFRSHGNHQWKRLLGDDANHLLNGKIVFQESVRWFPVWSYPTSHHIIRFLSIISESPAFLKLLTNLPDTFSLKKLFGILTISSDWKFIFLFFLKLLHLKSSFFRTEKIQQSSIRNWLQICGGM